ncbi:proQ/FINO family protein [Salmonella enterica subsp. salamae]|nr:proQ/FINO family protein [Salmonella enterica subsp. salamae]SQI67328.1 ProQ family protein [Salmonella enterica subsp. salamae]
MVAANINRKSAHQQGGVWQHTQQAAPEAAKTTSAHKVKPCNGKAPQNSTGGTQQEKQTASLPHERVRPETMTRSQWKRLKRIRTLTDLWPLLFDMDNPKPLKQGILDDILRDIAGRGLSLGKGAARAAVAGYVRRIRYKKALASGGARYDLNGQPCGEVTPEQQTAAGELKKTKRTVRKEENGHGE